MRYRDVFEYFDTPAPPVLYFFVDRIAAVLVWLNVNYLRVHPNYISLLSGIFALGAVMSFFEGKMIAGAVLYFLSFLMDCVDGPSARAMKKTTKLGVVLEVWFDSLRLVGSTMALYWTLDVNRPFELLVWAISFAAGVWLYPKLKESYGGILKKRKEGEKMGYRLFPIPAWMDAEVFAFFLSPILGIERFGFHFLVLWYFLSTLAMSAYTLMGF